MPNFEHYSISKQLDFVVFVHNRSIKVAESTVIHDLCEWLPRMNALVIGPGLGRNLTQMSRVRRIIAEAKDRQMNIVIDAVSYAVCFIFLHIRNPFTKLL